MLLKAAKKYLELGFSVVPLEYKTKVPIKGLRLKEYFERRPTEEEIEEWFKNNDKNIAIITGKISRLIVIDIENEEGLWHLTRELDKRDLKLPETAKVKTSNGWHIYFRLPEGEEINCKVKILPNVDIKAEGGYVVAPPSIHPSGKPYVFEKPIDEIKEIPRDVLNFIKELIGKKNDLKASKVIELYPGVEEGRRNVALTQLVGSWFRDGLSYSEVLECAKFFNQTRFKPPLPEKEVEAVVNSIYKRHLRSIEEKLKPAEECVVTEIPLGHKITFPFVDTEVIVKNITPRKNDLVAYLEIRTTNPTAKSKVLYQGKFNFNSQRAATDLEKTLRQSYKEAEVILSWKAFVETLRAKVKEIVKNKSDIEIFNLNSDEEPVEYLIYPFIIKDTTNAIYGDGASGKTTIALGFAVDVITREIDFDPEGFETCKVLYLDYEDQRSFIFSRLKRIVKGYNLNADYVANNFHYKKSTIPLTQDIDQVYELVLKEKYGLVIIDSVGRACEGDVNSAEAINSFFRAVESLNTTILLIHHTPKDKSKDMPFGSVYFVNNVRNLFHISRLFGGDEHSMYVSLVHKKCNTKIVTTPFLYRVGFDDETILFAKMETELITELRKSEYEAILSALRSGPKTAQELADILGKKPEKLKPRLSELKKKKKIANVDGLWTLIEG